MAPADGARAPADGVPVRETEALGGPLSCLVGDFAGDFGALRKLAERAGLGPGLGLEALRLLRLAKATSLAVDDLVAPRLKLLGRAGFRAVEGGLAAGGCATMVTIMDLTNMP